MVTKEQIKRANETARNAFEAVKRIYDLAAIVWQTISEDVAEQLGLRRLTGSWSSGDSGFLQRYGLLSDSERIILRRYLYTGFTGTKSRTLPESLVPFILVSVATRKFSQQPAVIWGVLKDINWQGQKAEIEPFMYEISEKRQQDPLEVTGLGIVSKRGSSIVEFDSKSLFEITDDTIGDITKEMVDWFRERLPEYP
jgi:hypothetical protein